MDREVKTFESFKEGTEFVVQPKQCFFEFLVVIGPVAMARVVHIGKVKRDEAGPFCFRELQPVKHFSDAGEVGHATIVVVVITRPHPLYGRLGTYKKVTRCLDTILLCQHPDWRTAIPVAILHDVSVAHRVYLILGRLVEGIVHQAMVLGEHACGDGVVVGKSLARKGRNEPLGSAAFGDEATEVWGLKARYIVVAKAV